MNNLFLKQILISVAVVQSVAQNADTNNILPVTNDVPAVPMEHNRVQTQLEHVFSALDTDHVEKATIDVYNNEQYTTICWNEKTILKLFSNGTSVGYIEYSISMELAANEHDHPHENATLEPFEIYDKTTHRKLILDFVTTKQDDVVTIKENRTVNCKSDKIYSKTFMQFPDKKVVEIKLKPIVRSRGLHYPSVQIKEEAHEVQEPPAFGEPATEVAPRGDLNPVQLGPATVMVTTGNDGDLGVINGSEASPKLAVPLQINQEAPVVEVVQSEPASSRVVPPPATTDLKVGETQIPTTPVTTVGDSVPHLDGGTGAPSKNVQDPITRNLLVPENAAVESPQTVEELLQTQTPNPLCGDNSKVMIKLQMGVVGEGAGGENVEKNIEVDLNNYQNNGYFDGALAALLRTHSGHLKCPLPKNVVPELQPPQPVGIGRSLQDVYTDFPDPTVSYMFPPSDRLGSFYVGADGKYYIVPRMLPDEEQEPSLLDKLTKNLKSAINKYI